ncbi:MAG: alpha/beta hydrolase, partial [Marinirhabdus sp.]|nr:alpha/beta hydrolase [Marinirhabdus sp.]
MKNTISLLIFFTCSMVFAQNETFVSKDISVSPFIDGTIMTPDSEEKLPLVIIIAGSGPTDRNGNQMMMKNNSLKYLAEGLYKEGIASFRYDKRIVKQMKERNVNEEGISFEDFIKDARDVVSYFERADAFSKIIVLGHSQGATIGLVAAQEFADGYISVAGPGRSIDDVIVDQLSQQAPGLQENARTSFDDLRVNGVAANYNAG